MNKNILIVEDEQKLRELFSEILIDAGYNVFTSADGLKAVYVTAQIDLAIVDINMPNMHGLQFIDHFRELNMCPIIVASGYLDGFGEELSRQENICLLQKPVSLENLLSTVAKLLEQEEQTPFKSPPQTEQFQP